MASVNIPSQAKKAAYTILDDSDYVGYSEAVDAIKPDTDAKVTGLKGTAYMFADIYQQMLAVQDGQSDCLFFIHGFANTLDDSLENIVKLHDIYIKPKDSGVDHLIFVSWPSIGSLVGTYWNDQNDAEATGQVLGRLFSKLKGFFVDLFEINKMDRCSNKIHLAAHSMGNTVLDYMLRNINDNNLYTLFGEILLLNADTPYDVFEPGGSFNKLPELSDRTHIYINRSDDVLSKLSTYTKNLKRRLGHKGPKTRKNLNEEVFIVDTTHAGRGNTAREKMLDHWGYLERNPVIKDVLHVLSGIDEDDIPGRDKWDQETQYFCL